MRRGEESQISSLGSRLGPAVDPQFAVDIAGVDFDRVQRQEKPGTDFLIGQSLGDELEHFKFPFTQWLDQFRCCEGSF